MLLITEKCLRLQQFLQQMMERFLPVDYGKMSKASTIFAANDGAISSSVLKILDPKGLTIYGNSRNIVLWMNTSEEECAIRESKNDGFF